jgi:hypothetical protein
MPLESRFVRLVDLMEAFVSCRDRSQRHVREMEGEFARQLDADQRFEDLQYALAMFGANGYDMEAPLATECSRALNTLRGICVYRDCEGAIVEGTRYCHRHQSG